MRFFDRLFGRQSGKVIGIILFFLILSSGTSTPQSKNTIAPNDADAYYNRGVAYYLKQEYDRAWEDVYKAQGLGYKVHPEFLNDLRNASGRQR
ncbi:MAG: tetratricopeptide repeat protein [Nitrospirota bacterium]